jgi:hypothetical protein
MTQTINALHCHVRESDPEQQSCSLWPRRRHERATLACTTEGSGETRQRPPLLRVAPPSAVFLGEQLAEHSSHDHRHRNGEDG